MTGRGAGYCAGFGMPGYANPVGGWGMGRGGGRGRTGCGRGGFGFRNAYYATGLTGWQRGGAFAPVASTVTPEFRAATLKAQAEQMEAALADIRRQLETLENTTKTE